MDTRIVFLSILLGLCVIVNHIMWTMYDENDEEGLD